MSEPKTVAQTTTEILPGLHHFKILDDRIKTQSDAYALVQAGRVVLIDPLPLDPARLARLGRVEAIVLGSPSHQRSAWRYRKELNAKVHAPEGWKDLDEKPDATYKEGETLPGGIRALHAPGPGNAHHVFHLAGKPGALLVTDLWHVTGSGVEFLPDKYLTDPDRARDSARRLLEVDFEVLCFGHGDPIHKGGRNVVSDLVKRESAARRKK